MAVTLVSTGVQFPDNSIQTTAAPSTIGVGQTWQNVVASRAAGTTYTNSTGKTIQVGIRSQGANAVLRVNGVIAAQSGVNDAGNFIGALVPPGNTYQLQAGAPKPDWGELR
jgi:hypothetical protein